MGLHLVLTCSLETVLVCCHCAAQHACLPPTLFRTHNACFFSLFDLVSNFLLQGASGFVFHHANAYETQDGRVIVDAIRYPTLPDFEQACGSGRNFIQVSTFAQLTICCIPRITEPLSMHFVSICSLAGQMLFT